MCENSRRRRVVRGRLGLPAMLLALATAPVMSEELLDPTRPPATLAAAGPGRGVSSEPRVTSIVSRGGSRVAVVEGHVLRVGDRLGAHRVVAIEASSVRVTGPASASATVWSLYRTPVVKQAATDREDSAR